MTLKDKIQWIETRPRFKPKTSLHHLEEVYDKEPLQHDAYYVQVIGTNGKGSTAKMLTDIVKDTYTVGTFMSPYVYTFNERILLNGMPVSDDVLEKGLNFAMSLYEKYPLLTFFELLTLSALYIFKKNNVSIVIMEAGIGGRLDATSILTYQLTLFTSVGHDHLHILGPTLQDVCQDKVAAVKKHGYLMSTLENTYDEILQHHVSHVGAKWLNVSKKPYDILSYQPMTFTYDEILYTLSYIGEHYASNARLAIEAAKEIGMHLSQIQVGLLSSKLPGRFEILGHVILDAAHNIEAIEALKKTCEHLYEEQGIYVIMSVLGDKDIKQMASSLSEIATVIVTSFDDVRYEDVSSKIGDDVIFIQDMNEAYTYVSNIKDDDAIIIFTGSIHFISQVKSKLLNTF